MIENWDLNSIGNWDLSSPIENWDLSSIDKQANWEVGFKLTWELGFKQVDCELGFKLKNCDFKQELAFKGGLMRTGI